MLGDDAGLHRAEVVDASRADTAPVSTNVVGIEIVPDSGLRADSTDVEAACVGVADVIAVPAEQNPAGGAVLR